MKLTAPVFIVLFLFVLGANVALGVDSFGGNRLVNPISCNTFGACANNILQFLLNLSIPLTAIMVMVGGFQMLTAGGDPAKFTTGRKTVTYAAIGFAVILISRGVVDIIRSLF